MMVTEGITSLAALVIVYLVWSFPTAYLITRLLTDNDIRQLGSGNTGANNTWREVSPAAQFSLVCPNPLPGFGTILRPPFCGPHVLSSNVGAVCRPGHICPVEYGAVTCKEFDLSVGAGH